MRSSIYIGLLIFTGLLFSSCSQRITGVWVVDRYATLLPGLEQKGVTLTNIGTMTFNADGTGDKKLGYNVLGITRNDTLPFRWNKTDHYITILGEESALAKTWIIMESSGSEQEWNSTDGANEVQVLNLKRQKE